MSNYAECTGDIIHGPGVSNVVADTISQPPAAPTCHIAANTSLSVCFSTPAAVAQPVLDYTPMGAAQQSCPGVAALCASSRLRLTTQHVRGQPLLGDSSMGVFRPVVPLSFRQQVLDTMHNIGHPGTRASKWLIMSRCVWKRAAADVTATACVCLTCQQSKVIRHVYVGPQRI